MKRCFLPCSCNDLSEEMFSAVTSLLSFFRVWSEVEGQQFKNTCKSGTGMLVHLLIKKNDSLCPAYGNKKGQGDFAILETKSQVVQEQVVPEQNLPKLELKSRMLWTRSEESVMLRCSVVSFILGTLTVQQTAEVLNLLLHNGTCSYTEGRWQEHIWGKCTILCFPTRIVSYETWRCLFFF